MSPVLYYVIVTVIAWAKLNRIIYLSELIPNLIVLNITNAVNENCTYYIQDFTMSNVVKNYINFTLILTE